MFILVEWYKSECLISIVGGAGASVQLWVGGINMVLSTASVHLS